LKSYRRQGDVLVPMISELLSAKRPEVGVSRAKSQTPRFIEPLARGLSILRAFTSQDRWLGNKEIARRVQLPNATANRLIKTLTELGYLHFSPMIRKYRLSPSVLGLGYYAVASSSMRVLVRKQMQRFADEFNIFVTLGERDRLDIVILEICHSNNSLVTLRLETSTRVPVANTALGWALISALPDPERDYLLAHIQKKEGERWPVIDRNIRRALAQIKKSDYCVSLGAWRSEISTVSVPLVPADRSSVLVLGCAGPPSFLPSGRIAQEIGPALVDLSRRLSTELAEGRL
jgi:DNA-binding IclR family transcriptional regulator